MLNVLSIMFVCGLRCGQGMNTIVQDYNLNTFTFDSLGFDQSRYCLSILCGNTSLVFLPVNKAYHSNVLAIQIH